MKAADKDHRVFLDDILSAIGLVEQYTVKGKKEFFENHLVQDAAIRQVSIIGEAAKRLPKNLIATYTDIPWKEIIGMRNIIVHDYSEIDLPIVWTVIERDLPRLRKAIKRNRTTR